MFDKILIANRGEIACRVIKTARRMGIATVAVYSEADRDGLHVEMADEGVAIGPPPAAQSYLLADKIIEAAKQTGAQAIHPGYGFLSENADFARQLVEAGIAFIGPGVRAIEVMGDKIQSKKFADEAGVNTVPGHLGVIESPDEAIRIAEEIGFPVMIKASAGGGGKGMRVAYSRDETAEGFSSAMSEAKSSFGDDRVFIEKFVERPRHIEIQVLADRHGNTLYLGERECSIQRRNQKVIEEAPSPFLDAETRKAMGEQAVALAKAVDYESAGTVEFIVDKDRNFYFLEMNTRLQVEHPVTELITGIDLVEQMIRVAAGEKLTITQRDVSLDGWAIESRIYAEDPYRNFLPSIGRLTRYRPPKEGIANGVTVRNDTGVFEGGEISMHYDPMIAKLITHAKDRETAVAAMSIALDEFVLDGIGHNVPFLADLMQHSRWRRGDLSTDFIATEYPSGFQGVEPTADERLVLAAVAAAIDHVQNRRRRHINGQLGGPEVRFAADRIVAFSGTTLALRVSEREDGALVFTASESGKSNAAATEMVVNSDWWPGDPIWRGQVNGRDLSVQVRPFMNGANLRHGGASEDVRVFTAREAELAALMPVKVAPDTSKLLLCPMPGLVTNIAVDVGTNVQAGDTLCTVEAMKMENILRAERDGVVKVVRAAPGDSLAVDAIIMEFE